MRNRGSGIVRDTGWAGVSEATNLVTGFLILNLLIRQLGPASYGRYVAVMAFTGILVMLSSSWVVMVLLQHAIQAQRELREAFASALALALPTALLAFTVGLVLSPLVLPGVPLRVVMGFAGAELLAGSLVNLSAAAVQVAHGLPAATKVRLLQMITRFGVVVALAASQQFDLETLAGTLLAAYAVLGSVVFLVTVKRLGLRLTPRRPRLRDVKDGMPYAGVMVAFAVQEDSDKIILVRFVDPVAVGLYAASYRIVQLAFLPIRALIGSSHPRFLVDTPGVRNEHVERALRYTRPTILYSVLAAALVAVAAPVVPAFFGAEYEGTRALLIALAPLLVLRSFSLFPLNALMGLSRYGLRFSLIAVAALANIALNLALIPLIGVWGAVAATILTEVLVAVAVWLVIMRAQRRHDERTLAQEAGLDPQVTGVGSGRQRGD
jgi:O-antigen/teichoic acid export membrane protein